MWSRRFWWFGMSFLLRNLEFCSWLFLFLKAHCIIIHNVLCSMPALSCFGRIWLVTIKFYVFFRLSSHIHTFNSLSGFFIIFFLPVLLADFPNHLDLFKSVPHVFWFDSVVGSRFLWFFKPILSLYFVGWFWLMQILKTHKYVLFTFGLNLFF